MIIPIIEKYIKEPKIAYFSMEIGLRPDIPTYSGGLGVLAGDTLRSAADLNLPCRMGPFSIDDYCTRKSDCYH